MTEREWNREQGYKGGILLKYTADLNELKEFAMVMKDKNVNGKIYVNQANRNLEEPILSDEDTAGRQPLQMLRIVIQTDQESIYYEYLFNDAVDLEEINVQLEDMYAFFGKEIVSVEYMNDLIR
jgi:hypothetical protein